MTDTATIASTIHRLATSCLCFCCLLSNGVTVSHPPSPHHVSSSRLSPLPYLMAGCQCQVIAPSGPRHALSDASARGIGAKGPFLPAAAMVVIVDVVGSWRPRGTILWSAVFFWGKLWENACLRNKNCKAHNPGLGKKLHPKTTKVGSSSPPVNRHWVSVTPHNQSWIRQNPSQRGKTSKNILRRG